MGMIAAAGTRSGVDAAGPEIGMTRVVGQRGDGAAQPALTFVRKFRKQLEDYVHTGGKSQTGRLTL